MKTLAGFDRNGRVCVPTIEVSIKQFIGRSHTQWMYIIYLLIGKWTGSTS